MSLLVRPTLITAAYTTVSCVSGAPPTVGVIMRRKRTAGMSKANLDAVDILFLLRGLIGYSAFVSWADVIVRAIRGEASKENLKTFTSSGLLLGFWTLTSGARVREMASLRGAAVELRGLAHDAATQSELRDRQAVEREKAASRQQTLMLALTKWLVALAALTLAVAIAAIVVAIAQ